MRSLRTSRRCSNASAPRAESGEAIHGQAAPQLTFPNELPMSGIAGVLALGERPPEPDWGARLARALRHRGPDGDGVYADGRIVLAHTRLAFQDTGSGGAQPMRSAEGRSRIVLDGEITNHAGRREALMARGARFDSEADTEVLLETLERDGPRGLDDLCGRWAFALWDRARERLLLGRDRLGRKPLLYARTPEWFAFASEAAALLELPFVRARLDRAVLPLWLTHGYAPAPHTLIAGIKKLPAASWMEVSRETPSALPVRWWTLPAPDPRAHADAAWFEAFDQGLAEAAKLRTMSDVPIGMFRSGEAGSHVVLEALSRAGQPPIRTYSPAAPDDLAAEASAVLEHLSEPLGDSAVVTRALLAREASKDVKVIVNSDGVVELFGGAPRYRFARRADFAAHVPGVGAWLAAGSVRAAEALALLRDAGPGPAARQVGALWGLADLAALLAPGGPPAAALDPPSLPGAAGPGLTDALFAWDIGVSLPDGLLAMVDLASMRHGVENHSPLLDHRLFEWVARLPPGRRVHPLFGGTLLRKHAPGRIADAALRSKPHDFGPPVEPWLRGPLRGWLDGLLGGSATIAPLFRSGALPALLADHHAGRGGERMPLRLWSLAALETWARAHRIEVA